MNVKNIALESVERDLFYNYGPVTLKNVDFIENLSLKKFRPITSMKQLS